ncbi:MAG: serine/threonine-protein phosphatase [Alphaproteobacteria bacterium]|nr:serine/threonine-protein phosphatase [Alphaproteobacteria bacterium]
MLSVHSAGLTHVGNRRSHNEDAFVDRPDLGVWAVADGAGGHDAGEVASGMLVETLGAIPAGLAAGDLLSEIRTRVAAVHEALLAEAAQRGPDVAIASTLVALCIRGAYFACLWAGDSRAYLWRGGLLTRITHDHSLVQELVDAGRIAPEAAETHPQANVITRAVGAADAEPFTLDKVSDHLVAGDRLLLCSDGLTKEISEAEIAAVLATEANAAAERLIAATLARPARDNVTVVVVDVTEGAD